MSIFEFNDYKAYLKAHFRQLPQHGRGQIQKLASYLRMHTTHISQIISGSKHFSQEQTLGVGKYLGLKPIELEYLIILVQKQRAGTKELKDYLDAKLTELKATSLVVSKRIEKDRVLTETEQAIFYSSWIYSAIRLFCSIENGQDIESIINKFAISRDKANEILNFLVHTNLCQEKNGKYLMLTRHTHIGTDSPFLSKHHINWRMKALQRNDNLEPSEFMFTGPFSLSKSDFKKIREQLVQLVEKTVQTVKESPEEELACLNIDFYKF